MSDDGTPAPRFPSGYSAARFDAPGVGGSLVLTACWSVKGGSGTTVVAATLALALSRSGADVVLADSSGDIPAALGVAEPSGPGMFDWLEAGPDVPPDALPRLLSAVTDRVSVLPCGQRNKAVPHEAESGSRLAAALRALAGSPQVVLDCGRAETAAQAALVDASDRSVLVLRPCYLALRRAVAAPRPTAVALVCEPERALGAADVEEVLGVPVVAEIAWDPAIARAIDAGLMATRLPRRLLHALRGVAA